MILLSTNANDFLIPKYTNKNLLFEFFKYSKHILIKVDEFWNIKCFQNVK